MIVEIRDMNDKHKHTQNLDCIGMTKCVDIICNENSILVVLRSFRVTRDLERSGSSIVQGNTEDGVS